MRSVKDWRATLSEAPVGVFAWCRSDGSPRSCTVTPYVVDDHLVVTSTLALPGKAIAAARDPRVALVAGGVLVQATASVAVDPSPAWFDRALRAKELAKYPPARALLAIPGHRRWFPWYVGRIVVRFDDPHVTPATIVDDRVSVAHLDGTALRIDALPPDTLVAPEIAAVSLPGVGDGPVDVLVHEERNDLAQLGQLHARGNVTDGLLRSPVVTGDLTPPARGTFGQIEVLRALRRAAAANAARVAGLPRMT